MMRVVTIAGFALCALAMLVLVIASRRDRNRVVPFGRLLDDVMLSRAARITLVLFWWWLAWHFLVTPPA
ncbi:DUF6186 family protein [Microbacterium sp. STN6]|uniref:DUF6186 family protein n=1 Tax=Microbacterium sp. STN6 TaxID=2995588 RepID=UPI002260D43F|nr:DUF6186 family protein [Microbacterium sp. STN6]MCX7522256.1 DUF6186 family protein [Microbacterium sp. STN6]